MIDQYTWLKSEKAELMRFLHDLPEDDIFSIRCEDVR